MPKGQSPKLKQSIYNIPISEIDTNCMALLRPAGSNEQIKVKLKREVESRSHVLFESVRSSFAESFSKFLKQFNHLSSDIEINIDNKSLAALGEEKDYIKEIVMKNISQPIPIILQQNLPSGQEIRN